MINIMCFIMCGPPGSGKSTLSKQLADQNNAKLFCFDSLPNSHNPKYAESVRKQMWADIAEELRAGQSIVCDDVHTKLKWRSGFLTTTADIPCKKVLVVMTTPLDECLQRNANRKFRLPNLVVENSYKNMEPPTLDEGFDEILYY